MSGSLHTTVLVTETTVFDQRSCLVGDPPSSLTFQEASWSARNTGHQTQAVMGPGDGQGTSSLLCSVWVHLRFQNISQGSH